MSKSLEPGQARHFVGRDLGTNGLQKLSADVISMREVKDLRDRLNTGLIRHYDGIQIQTVLHFNGILEKLEAVYFE